MLLYSELMEGARQDDGRSTCKETMLPTGLPTGYMLPSLPELELLLTCIIPQCEAIQKTVHFFGCTI